MEQREIIDLLTADVADEHGAIIQYLSHAYRMGEGEMACEIEEIAREEMRHFKWLNEALLVLGVDPVLTKRAPVVRDDRSLAELMAVDAQAEAHAISTYEQQIAMIDDPEIRRTLGRILVDERAHEQSFLKFAAELRDASDAAVASDHTGMAEDAETGDAAPALAAKAVAELNTDVSREYSTILMYLQQAWVADDCLVTRELFEDRAQEEMKHMGWFAELVGDLGGTPDLEFEPFPEARDIPTMMAIDREREVETTALYDRQREELATLPKVRATLDRVSAQESFHADDFSKLLAHAETVPAAEPSPEEASAVQPGSVGLPGPRFVVGDLYGKPQP